MAKKACSAKETKQEKEKAKSEVSSYRLKCDRTANGLSHFVMYGDVPKEKTLL